MGGTELLVLLGAGLAAGGAAAENKATGRTANRLREAGRLDRTSRGLQRTQEVQQIGRQAAVEQGALAA